MIEGIASQIPPCAMHALLLETPIQNPGYAPASYYSIAV